MSALLYVSAVLVFLRRVVRRMRVEAEKQPVVFYYFLQNYVDFIINGEGQQLP